MKRIISLIAILIFILGCTACGVNTTDNKIVEDDVKAMLPIMDSMILCVYEEGYEQHDPGDNGYFWTLMHYAVLNRVEETKEATFLDAEKKVIVDKSLIDETATATFDGIEDYPELTDDIEFISLSADGKSYELAPLDRSSYISEIVNIELKDDNTATAEVSFISTEDNEEIASWSFVLKKNSKAHEGKYKLTVVSME